MDDVTTIVRGVMIAEARALDAVCWRLVNLVGGDDLASRVERRMTDGGGLDYLFAGRKHEVALDGVVVWRGEWVGDAAEPYRCELHERWLVDPWFPATS